MSVKSVWLSAVILALGTAARAETVTTEDFAYGSSLRTDGAGAIYRLPIPEDVYRSVVRSDLGDLRVFNHDGEWVPHTIGVSPEVSDPVVVDEAPLPLFPIRGPVDRARPRLDLNVQTDENGAIVRVQEQAPGEPASRIGGYLLDASALSRPIESLRLEWSQSDESVIANVSVEGSDDLTDWRALVNQATVADLTYEGKTLEVRSIAVDSAGPKYLRLTWAEDSQALPLTQVWAILAPPPKTTPRHWTSLAGSRAEGESIIYVFESAGVLPTDRIQLRLGPPNTLIQGTIQSRAEDEGPWRTRHKDLFYHVTVQGLTLENDPITITSPTRDRYWRLELDKASPDPGDLQPTLELGWVPQDLYFLAHGEGPFTLAFGSAVVKPVGQPVDELLNTLQDDHKRALVKEARVDGRTDLGGSDRLKPPPPPLPWKEWVLWAVLAAGVLILTALAWRLYQDMNRPAN